MQCPSCRALYLADPGHTCTVCRVGLVPVPGRRRRTGSDTVPLAPETVREEITARLHALPSHEGRTVYTWPDEPVNDKEDTKS